MKNGIGRVFGMIAGVLLVLLGIISLFFPAKTIAWILVLIGVSVLVAGIGHIVAFFTKERLAYHNGWALLMGVLDVILAIIMLVTPGYMVAVAMAVLVGWWALFYGIARIATSIQIKRISKRWWIMLTIGIFGVLAGLIMIFFPGMGAGALGIFASVMASIFLIVAGAGMIGDFA